MAVIDYVKGELVTPEGKKVKSITEGTGAAVPAGPIATGAGNFYAPGFGSNQVLDYEYYAEPPPVQPDTPSASGFAGDSQGSIGNSQGNSTDARNDDKSGAGAVPDFESWADAVMTGTSVLGLGGPITAVGGQLAGTVDFGDDFSNANQVDPEGWAQALEEAKNSLPPNTPPQQIIAHAATLFDNAHPGWGSPAGPDRSNDPSLANEITDPNFQDEPGTGITIERTTPVNVDTASGTKSGGGDGKTGAKPQGSISAPSQSATSHGRSGINQPGRGNGQGGNSDGRGGRDVGGIDSSGSSRGPGSNPDQRGFARGGYVPDYEQGVPTSMRQMYRRPQATQQAAPQKPNGDAGYNMGGAVMNRGGRGHTTENPVNKPVPVRTQRYTQSRMYGRPGRATGGFVAAQGFAEGGVVPRQGYDAGGAVTDDRFNPSPAAIADDGMVDNQPINADEGEYVIQRESADILGPEILNALNDPVMAKAFSDLFDAALGLDADTATDGVSPAPALPPMAPKKPGASLTGAL